ncbi:MAG: triose-phosphate isomerase family protein [Candidatus Paceibacterota bacterium]|jgi:triosephosphate isomerase
MKKYLLFNFKTNPTNLSQLEELLKIFQQYSLKITEKFKVVLFPPDIYLTETKKNLKTSFIFGAQNVFWFNKILATGETTPLMLKSLGVQYVIIGHSERRHYLEETNEMRNLKIKACLNNELIPVLCVGEQKKSENELMPNFRTKQEIFEQLNYAFRGIKINPPSGETNLMIAYEPVWAIGKIASQDLKASQSIITLIRFWLARRFGEKIAKHTPILYGGSVNYKNIKEFLSLKGINGVLIGSASTNKNELMKIFKMVEK